MERSMKCKEYMKKGLASCKCCRGRGGGWVTYLNDINGSTDDHWATCDRCRGKGRVMRDIPCNIRVLAIVFRDETKIKMRGQKTNTPPILNHNG